MVSIRKKVIHGKKYLYAEYSFRLPNGKVVKVSKLIKGKGEIGSKGLTDYFAKKEKESFVDYALKKYKQDLIFSKELIGYIEEVKVEYKHLMKKASKKQFLDILDRFTVNFTYESNAIEGNSLTLKDVTLIMHENIVPKGKDLREVYETKNTRQVMELLFKNRFKVNKKSILDIHKMLVKDTGVATGYKKLPNFLLMRSVKTTPPEKVDQEMNKLIGWYDKSIGAEHPLKVATEFHGQFERIHPFEDGNGRVGRVLFNVILLQNGYPPAIIRKSSRLAYFNALEAFDHGHQDKLLRFVIDKFKNTFKNFFKIYFEYV